MATISVKPQKQPDGTTLYRVMQGRKPMGENQIPARPADGGGFKTQRDAEALAASILRRLNLKRQADGRN